MMNGTWFLIEVEKQEDIGQNEKRRIRATNTTLEFEEPEAITFARKFKGSGVDVHPATEKDVKHETLFSSGDKCKKCQSGRIVLTSAVVGEGDMDPEPYYGFDNFTGHNKTVVSEDEWKAFEDKHLQHKQ